MMTCKPIHPILHNCGVCASEPQNMDADMKKVNKFATLVPVKPTGNFQSITVKWLSVLQN